MIWDAVHPRFWSPLRNAATKACPSRPLSAYAISTPMRRIWSGCCPYTESAAAAPRAALPRRAVNSRRCVRPLRIALRSLKPTTLRSGDEGEMVHKLASEADQDRPRRWVNRVIFWPRAGHFRSISQQRTYRGRRRWSGSCHEDTSAAICTWFLQGLTR
jgi:hypothetical protein